MVANDKIIFQYDGQKYTVSKAANPIILPSGQVFKGDGWAKEVFPPNPGKLTHLFNVKCVSLGLKDIADALGGVLATKINIKKVNKCPKGCKRPTGPFCSKCGSTVEATLIITPASR